VGDEPDVLIVGGGIGGLVLALSLHQAAISARVFEAAPDVLPLGVGINLLPHAMRELSELGLQEPLAACAIETRELAFYSRHGQFIYKEPRGRFAGYDWPQLSIHRADLHRVLLDAVTERLGRDALKLDHRCDQYCLGATLYHMLTGEPPFSGPTAQAVLARQLNSSPRSLRLVRPELSPAMEAAVLSALERLPDRRPSSAGELLRRVRA